MNVLVACEESQTVCKAFRERGHIAYSCDIQECSGGHPEWHICGDVLPILLGDCYFSTQDMNQHEIVGKWDLVIAHPPCTYLSNAGSRFLFPTKGNIDYKRYSLGLKGKEFFNRFYLYGLYGLGRIAIENPTPSKSYDLPAPSQIIQPYEYGHPYSKRTLLWLFGLPNLIPTNRIDEYTPFLPSNTGGFSRGQGRSRGIVHNARTLLKRFQA